MDTELREKVVLVTGASSGIGRAVALLFAREGAQVIATYHTDLKAAQELEAETQQFGGKVSIEQLDSTQADSIASLVKGINQRWAGVDVLVHAGAPYRRVNYDFEKGPLELWHESLQANLTSAFLLTRGVVPHMKERRWGRIVYVSTRAAVVGVEGTAHYTSAKAGLIGLTKVLAKEIGRYGILVNAVAPARVRTPKMEQMLSKEVMDQDDRMVAVGHLATAEDVARIILYLGSGWNTYINGEVLLLEGGGTLQKPLP